MGGDPRDEKRQRAGFGGGGVRSAGTSCAERRTSALHHLADKRAQRAELTGGDQRAGSPFVDEGCGGGSEGQLAAAALATRRGRASSLRCGAGGSPCRRCRGSDPGSAATRAAVRGQCLQSTNARLTEPGAGGATHHAAFGKDQVENTIDDAGSVHGENATHPPSGASQKSSAFTDERGSRRAPAGTRVCGATSERSPMTASLWITAS